MRKPVFVAFDKVGHKQACADQQTSWSLEITGIKTRDSSVLAANNRGADQTVQIYTAVFANAKSRFPHNAAQLIPTIHFIWSSLSRQGFIRRYTFFSTTS